MDRSRAVVCLSPQSAALPAIPLVRARLGSDTGCMDAWIALVGAVAGALIAFGGQYATRRAETREQTRALLLEQFALLIALSEDFRNRVWEERTQIASGVVAAWDLGTYGLAQARLRVLSRDPVLLSALDLLHKKGKALGIAWRLDPGNESGIEDAWIQYRAAIDQFVVASARAMDGHSHGRLKILPGRHTPPGDVIGAETFRGVADELDAARAIDH